MDGYACVVALTKTFKGNSNISLCVFHIGLDNNIVVK